MWKVLKKEHRCAQRAGTPICQPLRSKVLVSLPLTPPVHRCPGLKIKHPRSMQPGLPSLEVSVKWWPVHVGCVILNGRVVCRGLHVSMIDSAVTDLATARPCSAADRPSTCGSRPAQTWLRLGEEAGLWSPSHLAPPHFHTQLIPQAGEVASSSWTLPAA